MKAMLLLLALWAEGGSAPSVKIKVKVTPIPPLNLNQAALGTSFNLNPDKLKLVPVPTPQPLPDSQILARTSPQNPFITVTPGFTERQASARLGTGSELVADFLERHSNAPYNDNAQTRDVGDAKVTGETYTQISAKINSRLLELEHKWREERVAPANAMNLSPDIGSGHQAEIAVIKHEGLDIINVSEEVKRDGKVIGEIDAETRTHLIEVASGDLNSGKKTKIQQFQFFLRQEAKKRGKKVRYYYDPEKAAPEDIARIIKIGRKAGVAVEFLPIPWNTDGRLN